MSLDDDDPACSGSENYTIHLPQRTNEGMVKVTVTRTKTLRRPKTLLSVNHVLLLTFLTACSFAQVTTAVHHAVQDVSVQGYSRSNGGATIVRFRFMCGGDKNLGGFVNKERELELGLAKHKCEPPFIADSHVKISCLADSAAGGQQPLAPAETNVVAEFSLNQENLAAFNQTYKVCVRTATTATGKPGAVWRPSSYVFVPPFSDLLVLEDSNQGRQSDLNQSENGEIEPDMQELFADELGKHENSAADKFTTEEEETLFREYAYHDWNLEGTTDPWALSRVRRQQDSFPSVRVLDLRLEDVNAKTTYTDDGRITVREGTEVKVNLVGFGLTNNTYIRFTTSVQNYSDKCGYEERHTKTKPFLITSPNDEGEYASVFIGGTDLKYQNGDNLYFVCVQDPETGEYIHQGQSKHLQIEVYTLLLPNWLSIILLIILLCMSGLFSGLNLGLMSLDQTELRIVMNTGSDKEKSYAKAIMPIRGMGNFLLCSILLGNVLVNNTLTILLDTLTGGGGIVAVIGATLGIVVFGEIIPQAICSRHGLAVGANTILLTKFFMLVTSPLAYPISKILDKILGAEIGTVYNRERLMELIKVTDAYTDLEKDEVRIVTGALVLKQKSVKDVMTRLDDCYMLPINTVLNFETISEIKEQGYSRIPVFDGERSNVKHILFAKDLLFIDPDDNKPLEEICKFYKNDVNFVYQDTALNDMFDEFKSGDKGHMALVTEVNNEGDGDPYYETVGLLTLEDIIEEIIQQEINDETDVVLDNKTKKKRKKHHKKDADFKMFLEKTKTRVTITPHLSLAILQFLTTTVKSFSPDVMSPRILQKMLNMDVYRDIKMKKDKKRNAEEDENEGVIIMKGKPVDYFILIIEGRVQITIGQENHKFVEGPFTTFGEQMLEQAMALPSSPLMGGGPPALPEPTRGTSISLSLHSSGNNETGLTGKTLKKTNTQLNIDTTSRRAGSADSGMPYLANSAKVPTFIPDYTVKFITDGVYLKIRKATYLVALKASRMNNLNSDSGVFNDKELDYALERVCEDDHDEFGFTPNCSRSPDKYFDPNGAPRSNTATPTDIRRESLRSSLSIMKSRFMGNQLKRSSTSIDKSKDEFWDGMANPAMDNRSEETALNDHNNSGDHALTPNGGGILDTSGSSPGGLLMSHHISAAALNSYNMQPLAAGGAGDGLGGDGGAKAPLSLPLKQRDHILEKQSFSEPMRPADLNTPTHHTSSGTHTTVISVRGSNNGGIDNKSLAINIPEPTSQQQITVASAAEVGGGIDSTGTKSATPVGGALEVDSESSLRTVTTNAATPDYNNGDTASKQSSDGGQMSPNDRTSLLGPPHTVS